MQPTGPPARRHLAQGFAPGRDAGMDVETADAMHRMLHDLRREKHAAGIAVKAIRHRRTDPTPEGARAPKASKRRVAERRRAGPPAMTALPAAVAEA